MANTPPTTPPPVMGRLRLALATQGYAIGAFIWITVEERGVVVVSLFGLAGSLLAAVYLSRTVRGQTRPIMRLGWQVVRGGVVGGGAAVIAAGLMFLKNAAHAHLFPDFPPLLLLAMLERAPTWATAGALVGLALHLLRPSGR